MSDGVKIALVAGGVAVAAYFVVQAVKPKTVPIGTAPSSTTTAFISGIVSAAGSFGKLFGSSSTPSAPANAPLTAIGIPSADTTAYGTSEDYNAAQGDYGPYLPSSSLPSS